MVAWRANSLSAISVSHLCASSSPGYPHPVPYLRKGKAMKDGSSPWAPTLWKNNGLLFPKATPSRIYQNTLTKHPVSTTTFLCPFKLTILDSSTTVCTAQCEDY